MSELIRLANRLRAATDAELARAITRRTIATTHLVDFFDLAEALLAPKNLHSFIAGLSLSQVRTLAAIVAERETGWVATDNAADAATASATEALDQAFLTYRDGERTFAFESVAEVFGELLRASRVDLTATTSLRIVSEADLNGPSQDAIDRDSSVAAFETIQGLTELVFDLETRLIREVGKASVGLPDVKRLANFLHRDNDFARALFKLAELSGLMVLRHARWRLGPNAGAWVRWQPAERWRHLADSWLQVLGEHSAGELLAILERAPHRPASLKLGLAEAYPLGDSAVASHIEQLANFAEQIGITSAGYPASWGEAVLRQDLAVAEKLLDSALPAVQRRIIVQADLTVVTTGPLPTADELLIRRFAEAERIGIASTYRLSALSITHGLETGLTIDEIRSTLDDLSGKPLPQPVDYLLREAATRFGRLVVREGESFTTVIESSDPILLAQIRSDQRLNPFALQDLKIAETGGGSRPALASRFETELVYFGLREAGFAAIRLDRGGEIVSPIRTLEHHLAAGSEGGLREDIARLRAAEKRLGDEPDDDIVIRQIHLALKNKTRLQITVLTSAGTEQQYLLEPIGLANGRLRGKDRKADIERTLPLSSITSVSLA